MRYTQIALAATPVFFTYVSAYGSAIIKNSCADDVYSWSCSDHPGEMTTIKGGSSHPETYYSKKEGGGISLKIGVKYTSGDKVDKIPGIWDQPAPDMTQFEYTVGTPGPPANAVFYDISNINGYPFVAGGVKMTSSDGKVNVHCPKGVRYCQGAYNAPKDDHATGSAGDHVDLTLELCSDAPGMTIGGKNAGSAGQDGDQDGGNQGSSGDQSPAPASSAPATTPAPSSPVSQPSQTHDQPPQDDHQSQKEQKSQPEVAAPKELAVEPVEQPQQQQQQQQQQGSPAQADVTVVRTVTADPVVVTVNAKRDVHQHAHQHIHNKINKKRHGN